jgi:hypothetical protein
VTCRDAQDILLLYRPGTLDGEDPQIAKAIEFAAQDLELTQWFKQHQAFQAAMRLKFRQIEIPAHLKVALLTRVLIPEACRLAPIWQHRNGAGLRWFPRATQRPVRRNG